MKSEPLLLSAIHFIDESEITSSMLKADIQNLARKDNEMYYTPGSASFVEEYKNSTAGGSWSFEFGFTFPGPITEEKSKQIIEAGAVVMFSESDRVIVVHHNDIFRNAPIKPEIQSNAQKTVIKYSFNSLFKL